MSPQNSLFGKFDVNSYLYRLYDNSDKTVQSFHTNTTLTSKYKTNVCSNILCCLFNSQTIFGTWQHALQNFLYGRVIGLEACSEILVVVKSQQTWQTAVWFSVQGFGRLNMQFSSLRFHLKGVRRTSQSR